MSDIYTIYCRDRDDSRADRMAQLPAHLAHMESVLDDVLLAAPLHDEEGEFVGSLLAVKAASAAEARAFIERDPYYRIGIWEQIRISRLGVSAGAWVGGKPW